MDFYEFIKPELLILIPVLYFVGIGLKKSKLPDYRIPLLLGAFSVLLCAAWVIATSDISGARDVACALFIAVTQGILTAGASVIFISSPFNSKRKIKKEGILSCQIRFSF